MLKNWIDSENYKLQYPEDWEIRSKFIESSEINNCKYKCMYYGENYLLYIKE